MVAGNYWLSGPSGSDTQDKSEAHRSIVAGASGKFIASAVLVPADIVVITYDVLSEDGFRSGGH